MMSKLSCPTCCLHERMRPHTGRVFRCSNRCLAPLHPPTKIAPPGTAMDTATNRILSKSCRTNPDGADFAISSSSAPSLFSVPPSSTSLNRGKETEGHASTSSQKNSVHAIRTISIVAHIDAGKTTTTERMLYYAGVVQRVGEVDSGTTTTDYMHDEMERGITIQSALVTLRWRGHPLYLLDTPGHADFTVEVERSVRVVDGVVALLDASAGVQAQSYTVLAQSIKYGVPVVFFINKMDKFNANFDMSVKSIKDKLKIEPLLLQFPLKGDDGEFTGVVDLVKLQCYRFSGEHGEIVNCTPVFKDEKEARSGNAEPNDMLGEAQYQDALQHRHQLLTQLTAVDDILSEEFIKALDETDGNEEEVERTLPSESIQAAIRRVMIAPPPASSNNSIREGRPRRILCPLLCGAARKDMGVQPLLHAIVDYLPSPLERPFTGVNAHGIPVSMPMNALVAPSTASSSFFSSPSLFANPPTPESSTPSIAVETAVLLQMPFWALAFKVCHTANPATGTRDALVYIRVFSGILRSPVGGAKGGMGGPSGTTRVLQNRSQGVEEKVGSLYVLHADTPIEVSALRPGEVGALFLKKTYTGDTLYAPPHKTPGAMQRGTGKRSDAVSDRRSSSTPAVLDGGNQTKNEEPKRKVELLNSMKESIPFQTSIATTISAASPKTATEMSSRSPAGVDPHLEDVFLLEGISTPPPVLSYSIEAATPGQAQRLDEALAELTREDPSLSFHTDDYGNRVLQGLGELHLEIALSRLRQEYDLQCRLLRAVVEYRETLLSPRRMDHASVSAEHLGGTPYAELSLSVEPCHEAQKGPSSGDAFCELFVRDEASTIGFDGTDEDFYTSSATPQCLLSPSLFSTSGDSHASPSSSFSRSSGHHVSSAVGARIEEKKRLREWARALQENFQHSITEACRLGPLAGMPLHGIAFTLEFFRVLGDGSSASPSGKQLPASLPPDERILRAVARNAVLTLIHHREDRKKARDDGGASVREGDKLKSKTSSERISHKKRPSSEEDEVGILEPIMQVEVHFTESGYAGEVIRTLHERRSLWMDVSNSTPERGGVIKALVPMRHLTHYSTALRAAVKGHATLSVHLHSYRLVRDEGVCRKILKNKGC